MRRIDSRTESCGSLNAYTDQLGRYPANCASWSRNSSSFSLERPQSVWCTIITSRVPRPCWEIANDRITSSEMIPPALRNRWISPGFSRNATCASTRQSMHITTAKCLSGDGPRPDEWCIAAVLLRRSISSIAVTATPSALLPGLVLVRDYRRTRDAPGRPIESNDVLDTPDTRDRAGRRAAHRHRLVPGRPNVPLRRRAGLCGGRCERLRRAHHDRGAGQLDGTLPLHGALAESVAQRPAQPVARGRRFRRGKRVPDRNGGLRNDHRLGRRH